MHVLETASRLKHGHNDDSNGLVTAASRKQVTLGLRALLQVQCGEQQEGRNATTSTHCDRCGLQSARCVLSFLADEFVRSRNHQPLHDLSLPSST